MGHHKHRTWDRRSSVVTPPEGEGFSIETTEGATWALRALRAVGPESLRPTDGASGRFAMLIARLRDLGAQIEDLPADVETGRPGFRLVCKVEPAEVST
jgi:hypothetical protein